MKTISEQTRYSIREHYNRCDLFATWKDLIYLLSGQIEDSRGDVFESFQDMELQRDINRIYKASF